MAESQNLINFTRLKLTQVTLLIGTADMQIIFSYVD